MALVRETHLIQLRLRIQEVLNGIDPVASTGLIEPELLSEAHTALTTLLDAVDTKIDSQWKPGNT